MCRLVPTRCSLPQGACLQAKLTKQTPTLDPLHNCTGTQESMRDLEEMHLSENPCPRLWGWTRCFVCRQITESAGEHFWGLSIRTPSHKLQPQDTHFKSCPKQFDLCFKKGYQSKAMKEKKILGCNTGKTVKKIRSWGLSHCPYLQHVTTEWHSLLSSLLSPVPQSLLWKRPRCHLLSKIIPNLYIQICCWHSISNSQTEIGGFQIWPNL